MKKKQINIKASPLKRSEISLWRTLHNEDEGMMYPLPEKNTVLWKRLHGANPHIVRDQEKKVIACFSVSIHADGIATGGIAVARNLRGKGIASQILLKQEDLARNMGAHSFRCDVFNDNTAGIALMNKNGYRNFQWFEKPLVTKK